MKSILAILALLFTGIAVGEIDATMRHAGDYSHGYSIGYADGYAAPKPVTPTEKAANNLICHYAGLVCPKALK